METAGLKITQIWTATRGGAHKEIARGAYIHRCQTVTLERLKSRGQTFFLNQRTQEPSNTGTTTPNAKYTTGGKIGGTVMDARS